MLELRGKYSTAKVFTDTADSDTIGQIIKMLSESFAEGLNFRIMPDTHAGAGCAVGTTMTIKDKIVPNLVGSDIGCGMETAVLTVGEVDLARLDAVVNDKIPSGHKSRGSEHALCDKVLFNKLRCGKRIDLNKAKLSLGTLGGGNHFIELDRDDDGKVYLVVHTGSRYLGKQVAEVYQKLAVEEMRARGVRGFDAELAYLDGGLFDDYLNDMEIAQTFAVLNRQAIIGEIVSALKLKIDEQFSTIHNYIETSAMVLRKGAISAKSGEKVLIPINMRDGSLLCTGKGNADWNNSAPHGAGRLMKRGDAKASISLEDYQETMKGVYTSSVNQSTIDESPFAYKPIDEIMANVEPTVTIDKVITPLYNFKASA